MENEDEIFEEIEVDFSDNSDEDNDSKESDKEETKTQTEEEKDLTADSESSEDSEKKPKRRRPSRAAKRIRELSARNNELEQRLAKVEEGQKETQRASKNAAARSEKLTELRNKESAAQEAYVKAMEEQDFAGAAKAQSEITKWSTQVTALESVKDDDDGGFESVEKDTKRTTAQSSQSNEVPEGFKDFIDNRDWVQHPEGRVERKVAQFLRNEAVALEKEGFNVYEEDFYDELNNSLADYLKKEGLEESKDGGIVESKKTPPRQKESSTTTNRPNSQRSETKVRLTKADIEFCEQHGIEKKRFAKAKLARQKAERGN